MKTTLRIARSAIAAALTLATAGVLAESDPGGENHYILQCDAKCQDDLVASAIGPSFTGAWFDPAQSGHGLFIEVLPDNRMQVAWFTFNPAGTEQAWFVGTGTYSGNMATLTAVDQPTGGRWIPNFDPVRIAHNAWGTMRLTFTDCNHGKIDFASTLGYGVASMKLSRLTQPAGMTCP